MYTPPPSRLLWLWGGVAKKIAHLFNTPNHLLRFEIPNKRYFSIEHLRHINKALGRNALYLQTYAFHFR